MNKEKSDWKVVDLAFHALQYCCRWKEYPKIGNYKISIGKCKNPKNKKRENDDQNCRFEICPLWKGFTGHRCDVFLKQLDVDWGAQLPKERKGNNV